MLYGKIAADMAPRPDMWLFAHNFHRQMTQKFRVPLPEVRSIVNDDTVTEALYRASHFNDYSTPSNSGVEVMRKLDSDAKKDRPWFNRCFGSTSVEDLALSRSHMTLAPAGLMMKPAQTDGATTLRRAATTLLASSFEDGDATYHNLITYARGGKEAVIRGRGESYEQAKAKIIATSEAIDGADRRFVAAVERTVARAELEAFIEGKAVSGWSRVTMSMAADRAKRVHEEKLTMLISEASAIPGTSMAKAGSVDAQLIGLSVANRIKAYNERLTFYTGLTKELSASRRPRPPSPPPADTAVRRMEGAVKAEASQFAQRNREVRADGMLRSYFKGVEPAEYVGRIAASMVVDNAIPAVARGLHAVDEWTGGVLFECLKYVDPGYYNTKERRFLRDTCGLSQTFAQNVGDAVQYAGEAALLFYTFGSGNATKTAQLAGKAVPISEIATTVNRTAKVAEFELGITGIRHSGSKVPYNLRAMEAGRITQYHQRVDQFIAKERMPRITLNGVTQPLWRLPTVQCGLVEAEHTFTRVGGFCKEAGKLQHKFAELDAKQLLKHFGERVGKTDVKCERRIFKGSADLESMPKSGYSIYDVIDTKEGVVLDYKFFQYDRPDSRIFDTKRLQTMVDNLPKEIKQIYGIKPIFKDGAHTGKFEAVEVWRRPQ
jgi:hypothetical protein